MTTTATDTTPAAALAAEGQAVLNTAKDLLSELERAAAQGLEVSATDYNTAVTDVQLKSRRQAFLDKVHTDECAVHAAALYDVAARGNAAAEANVDAIQKIFARATRLAETIKVNSKQESYGATLALGLPRVDQEGDLDGVLCNLDPLSGLIPANPRSLVFRLNGRVFGSIGEVAGRYARPARV